MSTTPIRIGFSLPLSGPLGANGRSARLAHDIWAKRINSEGGLLGRPVELIVEDDRTDAALVPAIYLRLLDDETLDLVMGSYGTNCLLPAMPLVAERGRFFVGLMGVGVNQRFGYPGYFAMIPMGPDSNAALTEGFFSVASRQSPRPTSVALLSADAEFSRNPIAGARENARRYGFTVIDERTYPLETVDFAPIISDVSRVRPDLLLVCSYLSDSVGLVRAIAASGHKPKMVGGAMIGPQNADIKAELGPLLNGFVNYEYWAPVPAMQNPAVMRMLDTYQGLAAQAGVDALGHYMAPMAYAQLQVVEQAVRATGSLNDETLIAYARQSTFDTVVGPVTFGKDGEWTSSRVLQVQFDGLTDHSIEPFRNGRGQAVVAPDAFASGGLAYPYGKIIPPIP